MLCPRLLGWLVTLLITLLSLPTAIATGPAGAFERIGPFYQTYRIAVATWGADQKKILAGLADLTGTHPDGGANFREMLNYIDNEEYSVDFFKGDAEAGETDIDINDPDPKPTAVKLYFEGNVEIINLEKLFPGAEQTMPEVLAKIRTVLTSGMCFFLLLLLYHPAHDFSSPRRNERKREA
jgi:hypothetical protein